VRRDSVNEGKPEKIENGKPIGWKKKAATNKSGRGKLQDEKHPSTEPSEAWQGGGKGSRKRVDERPETRWRGRKVNYLNEKRNQKFSRYTSRGQKRGN